MSGNMRAVIGRRTHKAAVFGSRMALIVMLSVVLSSLASAAESSKTNYLVGESVVIRTTPSSTGLTIRFEDQAYRFLGEPEEVISYQPNVPGEYLIQETLADGSILETRFLVEQPIAVPVQPDVGNDTETAAPQDGPGLLALPPKEPILDPQDITAGAIEGVSATPPLEMATLERDERPLSAINTEIRVRTGKGTGVAASYTVRTRDGSTRRGSTADLGATLPQTSGAEVEFDLPDRHAAKVILRGVDLSQGVDLGVDDISEGSIDAPVKDRRWSTVYAIDPTEVSFTDGEVRAVATGTELYKCRAWDFDARTCLGTWEKIMDLVPGQEYAVPIDPLDPGFAESVASVGYDAQTGLTQLIITGSIPSPVETIANEWGAVIFNPTNRTILITHVRFTASQNLIAGAEGIVPSTGWGTAATRANWSGAMTLGPQDAAEFIVNVSGVSVNLNNVIIQVNATTNDTNLTADGYTTYARNANIQYPSVYFLNTSGRATYVARNLSPDEIEDFLITIDNTPGVATVPIGATLVFYFPPEWRNVTAASQTGWTVGTILGDEGSGRILIPQVASTAIAAGGSRNFTFSATPPDHDTSTVSIGYGMLLGPGANLNLAIVSSFIPALQTRNLSTRILDADDNRVLTTWTIGVSRTVDQYLSVPGPTDNGAGNIWGVTIVNPTNEPINVTQIDFDASINMFSSVVANHPAVTWSRPSTSDVRWNGTVVVPPQSARDFAVNITPLVTANSVGTITVTSVTTAGTLISTGLQSSMTTGTLQYPSMMALNTTGITFALKGFTPGTSKNITLRISNRGAGAAIPVGTDLEIYVPAGWTNITASSQTGWTITHIRSDPKGGGLVRASVATSTIAANAIRDFTFNATAPAVGANSTYRFDAWLMGETEQLASQMIQSTLQFAVTVNPTATGINITRVSDTLANVSNISAIAIRSRTYANQTGTFNLSARNATSGIYMTLRTGTITTTEDEWNITLVLNRTFEPRDFIEPSTGRLSLRWISTSQNMTALHEDLLWVNATYDTIPPSVQHSSTANVTYINTTSVNLSYLASDNNDLRNCSLLINGTLNATNSTPPNGTAGNFTVANLQNRAYYWGVRCFDLTGHRNETANRTLIVDTTVPNVLLAGPANLSAFTSSTVGFTINGSDANLANCSIVINGAINETNITPSNGTNTSFFIQLPDGNTTWTAECADFAGNIRRNASSRIVRVDTRPPTYANVNVTPDTDATYNATQRHTFTVNWTDANGISQVFFESNITGTMANLTPNNVSGTVHTYNFTTMPAGNFVWRMHANDTFGNWNRTPLQAYDIAKAESNVSLRINGSEENYPVDVNEVVNITGILFTPAVGNLEIHINGVRNASGSSPLQNITFFTTNGTRNVTVYYNATQNYSASNMTFRITVGDKLGPVINKTYPLNGTHVSAVNITFLFNATDATGVENCTLRINGTINATKTSGLVNDAENNITGGSFAEGTYVWSVRCTDPDGNSANSTNATFTVDRTPPAAFGLVSPANATVSTQDSPTFTWNASSDLYFSNYSLLIDNAIDFSSPNYIYVLTPVSNTSYQISDDLASGTIWNWKVIAYDRAGNPRESTQSFTYVVDTDMPAITILSPANNTYLNGTPLNVTYTVSDISTIVSCNITWNDASTQTNATINQSGFNFFTVTRPEGTSTFTVTCIDQAANTGMSDTNTLTIDITAPIEVNLTSPSDGTFSNNNTPRLNWTQSADANFANYTIIVSDDPGLTYANHSYVVTDAATNSYQVVAPWGDGTWWWKVLVFDLAGNVVDPSHSYTIDSTPPSAFSLLDPPNGSVSVNRTPTLSWEESNDINFANYTILVSSWSNFSAANHSYTLVNSPNTTFDVPVQWADNTIWYWKVIATDNATNTRNSTNTNQYTTDSQPPNLTLLTPANATTIQTNSSLITFTYNITDLGGISSCTIAINDSNAEVFEDNDPFVDMNTNQTFVEALQTGDYNWSIFCIDLAGNNVTSVRRMLTVNVTLPKSGWYDSSDRNSPQVNASANTTAMVVYASDLGGGLAIPLYRNWSGTAWGAEGVLPTAGSNIQWVRVEANPVLGHAEEIIAVTLSLDGNLDGYVWNGSDWAVFNDLGAVGTTRDAQKSFDIAYERQRGRLMLLYSLNVVNAAQDMAYRIWNGTGWTPQVIINDASAGADISVSFIRLAAKPANTSNEIIGAYIDVTNSDARALVWNGSTWASPINITTAIAITTEEDIGVAYEQRRMGALAVAGAGTLVNFTYWNGSAWNQTSNTDVNPSAAGTPNWISLNANPDGNEIMIVMVDSGNDLSTAQWANGAWSGALRHDATVDTNAARGADFAWEPVGSEGLLVWGTTAGQIDYREYSVASSWFAPGTNVTGTNTHTWVLATTVPTTLSTGTQILIGTQEATSTQVDGARWTGNAMTDINAAFTTSVGSTTYQRYDIGSERYAPRPTQYRNITLNRTVDGFGNIVSVWSTGGLSLVTNATSFSMGNYSARGFYMPLGAAVRFSALVESTNPGVSYLSWEAYVINSSGEHLICRRGNRTRTTSDVQVTGTSATVYSGSCTTTKQFLLNTSDTLRVYLWSNASMNNTITKHADNLSTFAEFEGYPIGNLTVSVVAPIADPRIGEGYNLTFACQVSCTQGYCLDVRVTPQINDTLTTFTALDYFIGNIILNATTTSPALLGNINGSVNASFNLTGKDYSFNNTLRCDVTSEFQNITSNLRNVTVLDNLAPNVTLVSPVNGSGFDPGNITFTINASDRRLGLCSLWTNTTGSWARNQTIIANNYTHTNFSSINVSAYGTYLWNVNCSDLSGNDTFAPTNFTFVIAGDIFLDGTDITFSPSAPVEGQNVTIIATIRNRANRIETNVRVAFYLGDPLDGGMQIGANITIPVLGAIANVSVNVSSNTSIGDTEIFVLIDPPYGTGDIFESDETNNLASATLSVSSWQLFYGNVSGNVTLGTGINTTLSTWLITNQTGNIYIADTDTLNGISFGDLKAIGRNTSGGAPAGSVNDFTDLDIGLNGTNFSDNVNDTYTVSGSPIALGSFIVQDIAIANVPLAPSVPGGNFTTGILWDADDSTDAVYDTTNKEDIVFVTRITRNLTSTYGVSDYAIRVPSRLKSYRGTVDTVIIYYEID